MNLSIALVALIFPASSISVIFRERTSSIIYKNYIKMREGMGQPDQRLGGFYIDLMWLGSREYNMAMLHRGCA
jgi:hypothetical protein